MPVLGRRTLIKTGVAAGAAALVPWAGAQGELRQIARDRTMIVAWGGREGAESGAAKDVRAALDRYREAVRAFVAPTLAEVRRLLAPGGWVAVFWRMSLTASPAMQVVASVLDAMGTAKAIRQRTEVAGV